MRVLDYTLLLALCCSGAQAADSKPLKPLKPCTITSKSGLTFDLNAIAVHPLHDGKKTHKTDREESWHASGYDYGSNFTLNFCVPVIEELEKVVGVDENLWRNVSAFYTKGGKTYSIGQTSTAPVLRGRKLVLNYTGGSPCEPSTTKRSIDLLAAAKNKDNDEDDDPRPPKSGSKPVRRKSTIISLLCDREITVKATVAFVGASEDECTYFFESRSSAACGGVSEEQQAVGPAGVFGIIALIAAADMLIILTSSCTRLLPARKGYNQLPTHTARGRGATRAEDENRLIDQLDEEWDD
ncbi:Cation-independent mannose-6-phosphate receptor CI-MPR [Xylographa pallens]|nr:Cation-independent mannose-6-phosphate receptor CI-MPR [Xylographa pallens]